MARKSTGGRAPRQALASQAAFEEQPVRLVVWADWVVAALTAGGDAALAAVQQLQQTAAEGGPAPVVVLEVENFGTGGASQLGLWGKYTLATLAVALGQEAAAEQLMEAAAAAAAQLQVESEGSAAESGDEGSSGSEGSSGDGSSSSDGGSWLYAAAWALPLGRQGEPEELSEEEEDEAPYGTPWDLLEGPMDQLVKGEDGACLWQASPALPRLGQAGPHRALALPCSGQLAVAFQHQLLISRDLKKLERWFFCMPRIVPASAACISQLAHLCAAGPACWCRW